MLRAFTYIKVSIYYKFTIKKKKKKKMAMPEVKLDIEQTMILE